MKCIHCGALLPDAAHFCPECGNKVEKNRFCPICHSEVGNEDKFCIQCGAILNNAQQSEESNNQQPSKEKNQETIVVSCPNCGKLIEENASVCSGCGYRLATKYTGPQVNFLICPSCGASVSDMNRVCPECGCRLERDKKKPSGISEIDSGKETRKVPKINRSVLILTILVILILFLGVWLFLRNNPLHTTEGTTPLPEVEQLDVSEDFGQEDNLEVDEDQDQAGWQNSQHDESQNETSN